MYKKFYEELEQVFDHFPKYNMKRLLGDFNAKVGRENIFKTTIRQESKRMRWTGHLARMGEEREVYRVLVWKSEGRRPLERPRGE